MGLEILEYDVEGAAYRDGIVVDGAYLLATVRRPLGQPVHLRKDLSKLSADTRSRLFAAFGALEAVVKEVAEEHYEAEAADPKTLDERIDAAARADRHLETVRLETARIEAENLVRLSEIEELDRNLAVIRNAASESAEAPPTE